LYTYGEESVWVAAVRVWEDLNGDALIRSRSRLDAAESLAHR
jgi:hypothetical protein